MAEPLGPDILIDVPEYSSGSDDDEGCDNGHGLDNLAEGELKLLHRADDDVKHTPVALPPQGLVSAADPSFRVERVHFSELSVWDFRRRVLEDLSLIHI